VKNTNLQGRYEIVSNHPRIILDSAHNPEGFNSLITEFKKEKIKFKETSLLFGAMKDKNIGEMLNSVKNIFNNIYFYEINYERTASIELLIEKAENLNLKYSIVKNLEEFLKEQVKGNEDNCLVIAGSMYLLGEIKSILPKLNLDNINVSM
jgi:dihydrofolate synthase/folylpolyglutamate synthase